MNYLIGSWYGKDEMAKRACILNGSGSAALMFSGFLMTAVIDLGGKGGLPGWKWYTSRNRLCCVPDQYSD
jgi:ACS family pantothenate transporter-like MFS transporter